jgi:L-fucose mutarotase
MTPEPGEGEEVGTQLREAARAPRDRIDAVERFAFYKLASTAFVIVRTAESRKYGCVLLRKGVVGFGA